MRTFAAVRARLRVPLLVASAVTLAAACGSGNRSIEPGRTERTATTTAATPAATPASTTPARGGTLVVSVRTEPQSFNPFTKRDGTSYLLGLLTQARLVRVNAATQDVEPFLAEKWTADPSGLRYRLTLRPGLTFADGTPATADDVVFSLKAVYDEASILADAVLVGGKPLTAVAIDPSTVDIVFPSAFGPGLRLLDTIPILPKHKLQAALDAHAFGRAWTPATPPSELTGLGPFVITAYAPGERIELTRNPHYFRKDASGTALPYLDRLVVDVIPDQDAQMLAIEAGRSDTTTTEMRPQDFAPLKRAADRGAVQVIDAGVALDPDALWLNLLPGAFAGDPRAPWIQREELRQAINLAVDRQAFVDSVFLGAAEPVWGPVTPANKFWYSSSLPHPAQDTATARRLLAAIGLTDPDGDGRLADAAGRAARFTLLTAKGQTALERGAALVRDDLARIGLTVDVVSLEANALVQQFVSGKGYDAVYFHLSTTSTDPALSADFWLSGGSAHVWNFGPSARPADWEKEIDALMARQMVAPDQAERQRLFAEVQRIFAAHLPMIHFAAPRVFVAASSRLTNLAPAITRPQLLWSADTIRVTR